MLMMEQKENSHSDKYARSYREGRASVVGDVGRLQPLDESQANAGWLGR